MGLVFVPSYELLCHEQPDIDWDRAWPLVEQAYKYEGWRNVLVSIEAILLNLEALDAQFGAAPTVAHKNPTRLSVCEILEKYGLTEKDFKGAHGTNSKS